MRVRIAAVQYHLKKINNWDEFEKQLEAGERIIVGVNKFQAKNDELPDLLKINMNIQEEQIKFLNKIKSERNSEEVKIKLDALEKAAKGTDNLMPFIVDAVRAYCSVGEICNTMRKVFGEYKETVVI